MAWNLTAAFIETCSCNMLCPCWYGVRELMVMDQGWCASAWLLRVQHGQADGVTLGGRTLAMALDFPGPTLYDGNGGYEQAWVRNDGSAGSVNVITREAVLRFRHFKLSCSEFCAFAILRLEFPPSAL